MLDLGRFELLRLLQETNYLWRCADISSGTIQVNLVVILSPSFFLDKGCSTQVKCSANRMVDSAPSRPERICLCGLCVLKMRAMLLSSGGFSRLENFFYSHARIKKVSLTFGRSIVVTLILISHGVSSFTDRSPSTWSDLYR